MITRRTLLAASAAAAVATPALSAEPRQYKACVIGHTGRGNYGHEVDRIFLDRPNVITVGLSDPDEKGRSAAQKRTGAQRAYADYREMLDKERPDLVAIGPRWTDQHKAMALAAIDAGSHIYTEKPIAADCADADAILAAADAKKRKVAVAHQIRLAPNVVHLKKKLDEGLIGPLVSMRAWGKQDPARAGGEDLIVLGTHMFDLMRLFAGDPRSCYASVTWKGNPITPADARQATENVGPIAGDDIHATYTFDNAIRATFQSTNRLQKTTGHWGLELTGSAGVVRILADVFPRVMMLRTKGWEKESRDDRWEPLPDDPARAIPDSERGFAHANRRVVDDWLAAIELDRDPQCSGRNAAKAIEMVMAVYASALRQHPVPLPLVDRAHPLLAR
jgi:predicted dehydrogenase